MLMKTGSDNQGFEHVMGREGLNENGKLLINLCDTKQSGRRRNHQDIHKTTRVSPSRTVKSD